LKRSATISPCGQYRYSLRRSWQQGRARKETTVTFIGLNPSTADAHIDDPTCRRCIGLAKSWGFETLIMVNLFAYRATDPLQLQKVKKPIGDKNDRYIARAVSLAHTTIACWGNHGELFDRSIVVGQRYANVLHSLRINKSGQPAHPLYLPGNIKPTPLIS